jgi:hypothetical protein
VPHIRWYAEGHTKDGVLRLLVDGEEWKSFDLLHPKILVDSRNVRLGLTLDGFNPFGNMNTFHSTWPPRRTARAHCSGYNPWSPGRLEESVDSF